jgi:hypothetical protein
MRIIKDMPSWRNSSLWRSGRRDAALVERQTPAATALKTTREKAAAVQPGDLAMKDSVRARERARIVAVPRRVRPHGLKMRGLNGLNMMSGMMILLITQMRIGGMPLGA